MAGISDFEWPFITTAIELAARCMPQGATQEAAKEFLFIELHAKRIPYRYHGQAKYEGWFFPLDYFWLRDDKLITHEITADATVIRRGIALVKAEPPPPMPRREGFIRLNPGARDNEERYVFDPHGRTTVIRLALVQLHRGDILRRLQERGFLPMQRELPLSAPTTTPPPPTTTTPTITPPVEEEEDSQPKWPTAEQLGISERAPKKRTALEKWGALCQQKPKEFNADMLRAKKISGGALARHAGVDRGTAGAVLKLLRAWLTQHD